MAVSCRFFVYNELNEILPQYDELPKRLLRSAVIGFAASATSDTCSNSIRVIKTTKQTHKVLRTGIRASLLECAA